MQRYPHPSGLPKAVDHEPVPTPSLPLWKLRSNAPLLSASISPASTRNVMAPKLGSGYRKILGTPLPPVDLPFRSSLQRYFNRLDGPQEDSIDHLQINFHVGGTDPLRCAWNSRVPISCVRVLALPLFQPYLNKSTKSASRPRAPWICSVSLAKPRQRISSPSLPPVPLSFLLSLSSPSSSPGIDRSGPG